MPIKLAHAIEIVPIDSIKAYKRNAHVHSPAQIEKIAASIREFSFTQPILVDAAHTVIAGHGRLAAARKLKLDEVPIIVLDHLTQAQARALVLADNRIAEDASWDLDLIGEELASLERSDFELDVIGFTDAELDDLLPDLEAEADAILAAAEPKREPPAPVVEDAPDEDDDQVDEPEVPETVEIKPEVIGTIEYENECPSCGHKWGRK